MAHLPEVRPLASSSSAASVGSRGSGRNGNSGLDAAMDRMAASAPWFRTMNNQMLDRSAAIAAPEDRPVSEYRRIATFSKGYEYAPGSGIFVMFRDFTFGSEVKDARRKAEHEQRRSLVLAKQEENLRLLKRRLEERKAQLRSKWLESSAFYRTLMHRRDREREREATAGSGLGGPAVSSSVSEVRRAAREALPAAMGGNGSLVSPASSLGGSAGAFEAGSGDWGRDDVAPLPRSRGGSASTSALPPVERQAGGLPSSSSRPQTSSASTFSVASLDGVHGLDGGGRGTGLAMGPGGTSGVSLAPVRASALSAGAIGGAAGRGHGAAGRVSFSAGEAGRGGGGGMGGSATAAPMSRGRARELGFSPVQAAAGEAVVRAGRSWTECRPARAEAALRRQTAARRAAKRAAPGPE